MGGVNNQSLRDIWAFDINTNTWIQRNNFPSTARDLGSYFNLDNTGYIIGGFTGSTQLRDVWTYNINNDSWTRSIDYPGTETYRLGVINSQNLRAYMINGTETWEYNISGNAWLQKNNFVGTPRFQDIVIVISGRIFFGLGKRNNSIYGDFWEFIP